MQVKHRIHLGMFIERALFELFAISLDRHAHKHGALYLKDKLHHYVELFPVLNLDKYMHLFDHPLREQPYEFVAAMREVLRRILIQQNSQHKFVAAISYFQEHPSLDIDMLLEEMAIDWEETDSSYWTKAFAEFSSHFSYSSYPSAVSFTDVRELVPVNALEEQYFRNKNYSAILSLRDLSTGIGLYTDPFETDSDDSSVEKACRDFIKILIDEHYLPIIMSYDAELRLFISSVEEIVDAKFDLLLSKKTHGIYTNEWGVSNRGQWERDLEYFVSKLVLPSVTVPSFFLGLRISKKDLTSYIAHLSEERIPATIATYGLNFIFSDADLKDLYQVSSTVYQVHIAEAVETLCDLLIYFKSLSKTETAQSKEATSQIGGVVGALSDKRATKQIEDSKLSSAYQTQVQKKLEELGYVIMTSPKAGGQGVDFIAERDTIQYAIQCRYSSDKVTNTAVQQVFSGKHYYGCEHACIVTNTTFTPRALLLADKTGVILCPYNNLEVFR